MDTPQEKLAALAEKWRKNARELGRDGDPKGIWNATLTACADELTTLLSEHGGGGEAVAWPKWLHDRCIEALEKVEIQFAATGTRSAAVSETLMVARGLRPITTPVVDDAMVERAMRGFWREVEASGCEPPAWPYARDTLTPRWVRAAVTDALSGVSAPVGVEALREIQIAAHGDPEPGVTVESLLSWLRSVVDPALTPPAAAPSAPVVDDALQDACDEILNRLEGWAKAYPESMFHEPTKAEREWLHKERPGLMDCIAASMGRHMARMIEGDIAKLRAALSGVSAPVEHKGYCEGYCPKCDAALDDAPVGVEDHVRRQVGRLAQWSKCMSHNESYFGEPAGLVKSVTDELSHAVDPIYPPIVPPADPLAGVTIHTATLPLTPPAAAPRVECNRNCDCVGPCKMEKQP